MKEFQQNVMQSAIKERRVTIANDDGGLATSRDDAAWKAKVFARGCRGFIRNLKIRVKNDYQSGARTPKTITAVNHAQIDTAQSKFGGASGLFDGIDDYLSTPDHADWYYALGDFTIDLWIRFNALGGAGSEQAFYGQYVDANNRILITFYNSAGQWQFAVIALSGGTVQLYFHWNISITTATWYHFALVRSSTSNWYLFINGTSQGSPTVDGGSLSNEWPNNSAILTIAGYLGTNKFINGWIDEFRISKGIARWTSNFTPPTSEHSNDDYTVLLLHMNGTDGSQVFTDDASASPAPVNLPVYLKPTLSKGIVLSLTVTVPASQNGWYTHSVLQDWAYDSCIIVIGSVTTDLDIYYATAGDSDAYLMTNANTVSSVQNRRYHIQVDMSCLTIGDIPVSGIINIIQIPNTLGDFFFNSQSLNGGETRDLIPLIYGSGKLLGFNLSLEKSGGTPDDGNALLHIVIDDKDKLVSILQINASSGYVTTSGNALFAILKYDDTNKNYAIALNAMIPFQKSLRVYIVNTAASGNAWSVNFLGIYEVVA